LQEIVESLPPQLRLKVAVVQYLSHVERTPFFSGLEYECLAMLCR
jgi:hypothetical protein